TTAAAPATDAAAATPAPAETPESLATLFTPGGFDFDRAVAAIDASSLSDLRKTVARGALERARDNPDALQAALDQVRTLLGL
ncbi:MAG: hypothetical protein KDK09_09030, partial [Rhodobacteraceae bacterium]|nr:hypothetical protein [Paracoccaceae bacterium]